MNSKYFYGAYHPEHLIDLLRAGARFPAWQTFAFPSSSDETEINDFIENKFPALSEERYEVWLRFKLDGKSSKTSFSVEDICSAHFFSDHRHNATSAGVLHSLAVYGIKIGEPLENQFSPIIEEYTKKLRQHIARTIVKAWFPKVDISHNFLEQLILGYEYQQSPAPEKLPAIPSKMIWAHLVAYNPGLRKFEERPKVLVLQDIQEVLRRTDADFKKDLKLIGDKFSSKFSELVDQAEVSQGEISRWLLENRSTPGTYLYELEQYLNKSADQQSFFYTSLLYLQWRFEVLNKDYNGKLSDKKEVHYFLSNASKFEMEQAVAEALFTIVYAGGPRVFQKAMIEARVRLLSLSEFKDFEVIGRKGIDIEKQPSVKSSIPRLFQNARKGLGKLLDKVYKAMTTEKKKELKAKIKDVDITMAAMSKGEFDYGQYLKLCELFGVDVELYDDEPVKEVDQKSHGSYLKNQIPMINSNEMESVTTNRTDDKDNLTKEIKPEVIFAGEEVREVKNELDDQIVIQQDKDQARSNDELASSDIEKKHLEGRDKVANSIESMEMNSDANHIDKELIASTSPSVDGDKKKDKMKQLGTQTKKAKKPKQKNNHGNIDIVQKFDFPQND